MDVLIKKDHFRFSTEDIWYHNRDIQPLYFGILGKFTVSD